MHSEWTAVPDRYLRRDRLRVLRESQSDETFRVGIPFHHLEARGSQEFLGQGLIIFRADFGTNFFPVGEWHRKIQVSNIQGLILSRAEPHLNSVSVLIISSHMVE